MRIEPSRDQAGFSLVELLVVVIIIGILAAIAVPVFLNQREKAWAAMSKSDVRSMSKLEFSVMDQSGSFATTVGQLENQGFIRSEPDKQTHAVCRIGTTDHPEFIVAAQHDGAGVWLVASDQGAVVEGTSADIVDAMKAVDSLCDPDVVTP